MRIRISATFSILAPSPYYTYDDEAKRAQLHLTEFALERELEEEPAQDIAVECAAPSLLAGKRHQQKVYHLIIFLDPFLDIIPTEQAIRECLEAFIQSTNEVFARDNRTLRANSQSQYAFHQPSWRQLNLNRVLIQNLRKRFSNPSTNPNPNETVESSEPTDVASAQNGVAPVAVPTSDASTLIPRHEAVASELGDEVQAASVTRL